MKNEVAFGCEARLRLVIILECASLHASERECFTEAVRLLLHADEVGASLIFEKYSYTQYVCFFCIRFFECFFFDFLIALLGESNAAIKKTLFSILVNAIFCQIYAR